MYDGMRSTNEFACIYFIMVITVGNIIILQLLVAIVISNFDDSRKITEKRKIIDEIESHIEDGLSMSEALHKIIGKSFEIEDVEEPGNLKSIRISRKRANTYIIKGHLQKINYCYLLVIIFKEILTLIYANLILQCLNKICIEDRKSSQSPTSKVKVRKFWITYLILLINQ